MTDIQHIPLSKIRSPDDPVRTERDEQALKQLAANIAAGGVSTPIKVRPRGDGYEVVYGDRRFRAAKMAGNRVTIPAIVEEMDDAEALLEAFTENQLREDMTALDKARSIRRILETTGKTMFELEREGVLHHSTANNLLTYLEEYEAGAVPDTDEFALSRDEGVGKAVKVKQAFSAAGIPDTEDSVNTRRRILEKAAREGLTTVQTREVAKLVAAAEDDGHRESIIGTEYADPLFNRIIQAKRAIWRKENAREKRKESPNVSHKPVQEYIEAVRTFALAVREATREAGRGAFSPESVHLLSKWHHELRDSLDALEGAIPKE